MSSRWLPRIDRGALGGGGNGQTQDHQTARIIIGNEPAGDTLFVCDFLDPGDGSGIEAALAAASSPSDIWIRSGVYNLGAGTVTGPLVIPADISVRGAGPDSTIIRGRADQRHVLDISVASQVSHMTVELPLPASGATGVEAIVVRNGNILQSVFLRLPGNYTNTDLANESLRNGFNFRDFSIADKLLVTGAPRRLDETAANERFICFSTEGAPSETQTPLLLNDMVAVDGDVGFLVTTNAYLYGFSTSNPAEFGVYFRSASGAYAIDGNITILPASGITPRGVRVTDESALDVQDVRISGNHIELPTTTAGDGVLIESAGGSHAYHGVYNNFIESFDRGIVIDDVSVSKTVVTGNRIKGATTPVVDNGNLSETAHNRD